MQLRQVLRCSLPYRNPMSLIHRIRPTRTCPWSRPAGNVNFATTPHLRTDQRVTCVACLVSAGILLITWTAVLCTSSRRFCVFIYLCLCFMYDSPLSVLRII
jgi:hypothetical protein